jgi:hypothetical protein
MKKQATTMSEPTKSKKAAKKSDRYTTPKPSAVTPLPPDVTAILDSFEQSTGLSGLSVDLKERGDGFYLVIKVANPTDRFYGIVNNINETLPPENRFQGRVTLQREARLSWPTAPETRFFQQTLSERLTVGRNSVREEFFSRYITSVFGAEDHIAGAVNHLVFGRRGAGKSTLLVYAAKKLEAERKPTRGLPCRPTSNVRTRRSP